MICVCFMIVKCLVTVLTWDSNTFHINVDVFGYKVVIIADHKVEAILFTPLFHLFLCFTNLVIIIQYKTQSNDFGNS